VLYLTSSEMLWRLRAELMAIYIYPRFAIFYCQLFYVEVFDNFHLFTLNWFFTTVPNFRFCSLTYRFAFAKP